MTASGLLTALKAIPIEHGKRRRSRRRGWTMVAADVRARFWDGPAVAGRAVELSVGGALVFLPWTGSFTETDAMVAYSARSSLQLGEQLTVPCSVRWVSGGRGGLEFGVEFSEVDPADVAALALLVAAMTAAPRAGRRRRTGSMERRYLRIPHVAPARVRRATASRGLPTSGGPVPFAEVAGEWTTAMVLDLSAGGCRLRTRGRLRPGEQVEIELESSPGIPMMATVRWSRRTGLRATAGLEFANGEARDGTVRSLDCPELAVDVRRAQTSGARAVSAPEGVSTELLALALESVSEGSLITDGERRTIFANSAFTTITGYEADEIIGADCRVLQGPGSSPSTVQRMREALGAGRAFQGEILNYRKDGSEFWNHLTITPIADAGGVVTHFVSVQRDVTRQMEERRRLTHDAEHDGLTGLLNRAGLRRRLASALIVAAERGRATAVVLLDLDDFKAVNDAHGHDGGDQVLIAFAQRLSSFLRTGDEVARLGGDEFVLVLDDLEPSEAMIQVGRVLERLHEVLDAPVGLPDGAVLIRVSAGVALHPAHGAEPGALLRASDGALYRAKARSAGAPWWVAATEL